MRRFLREYAKAVLVVASVFGGAALALEVPELDAGARWAMQGLFNLTSEYRGAAITVIVLGLAWVLTVMNEIEGKQRESHNAARGRKEGEHARVARS